MQTRGRTFEATTEARCLYGAAKSKGAAEAEADAEVDTSQPESSAAAATPPPAQPQHGQQPGASSSQPASSSGQPAANGHPRHPPRRSSLTACDPLQNGLSRLRVGEGPASGAAGAAAGQGQRGGDDGEGLGHDSEAPAAVEQSPQA